MQVHISLMNGKFSGNQTRHTNHSFSLSISLFLFLCLSVSPPALEPALSLCSLNMPYHVFHSALTVFFILIIKQTISVCNTNSSIVSNLLIWQFLPSFVAVSPSYNNSYKIQRLKIANCCILCLAFSRPVTLIFIYKQYFVATVPGKTLSTVFNHSRNHGVIQCIYLWVGKLSSNLQCVWLSNYSLLNSVDKRNTLHRKCIKLSSQLQSNIELTP